MSIVSAADTRAVEQSISRIFRPKFFVLKIVKFPLAVT
jgi:hypothetical protein